MPLDVNRIGSNCDFESFKKKLLEKKKKSFEALGLTDEEKEQLALEVYCMSKFVIREAITKKIV